MFYPKSNAALQIIKPRSFPFVTGIARTYDTTYPQYYAHLTEAEYLFLVGSLNEIISGCWPCHCALVVGYLFMFVTFGLSLYIPYLCIKDGKQ